MQPDKKPNVETPDSVKAPATLNEFLRSLPRGSKIIDVQIPKSKTATTGVRG